MAEPRTEHEIRRELWKKLSTVRAGMLGVGPSENRMRPMTHYVDEEAAVIRFLTSRSTELAAMVGQGATAHYVVVDDRDGYYAWLEGTLSPSGDGAKVDDLWSPMAAAWFHGREDPDILLLTMPLREAEIWSSTDSTIHFGLEIARANLDRDHVPDVGSHDVIRF